MVNFFKLKYLKYATVKKGLYRRRNDNRNRFIISLYFYTNSYITIFDVNDDAKLYDCV